MTYRFEASVNNNFRFIIRRNFQNVQAVKLTKKYFQGSFLATSHNLFTRLDGSNSILLYCSVTISSRYTVWFDPSNFINKSRVVARTLPWFNTFYCMHCSVASNHVVLHPPIHVVCSLIQFCYCLIQSKCKLSRKQCSVDWPAVQTIISTGKLVNSSGVDNTGRSTDNHWRPGRISVFHSCKSTVWNSRRN